MAESNDVQALEKISSEVDESQIKVILSSHCIKAQTFLLNKLRKQSEQHKEICKFISNGNLKLETEIKLAEQEIQSLIISLETIKSANVEFKKEYLLTKDRRFEITERITKGINKYEDLWMISKHRYESIPLIQNCIQSKNRCNILKSNVILLENEVKQLVNEIKRKKTDFLNVDRIRIIELAQYIVNERPKTISSIKDTIDDITNISKELEELVQKQPDRRLNGKAAEELKKLQLKPINISDNNMIIDDQWPDLSKKDDSDTMLLPKLKLNNLDLDILSVKLNQIKKVDFHSTAPVKRTISSTKQQEQESNATKKSKPSEISDGYTSPYFKSIDLNSFENKTSSYSEKKLIHILEDIKLDKNETRNLVSKINPKELQDVSFIREEIPQPPKEIHVNSENEIEESSHNIEIEEIDLTPKPVSNNILNPPTQFLDPSQNSQINIASLDILTSKQEMEREMDGTISDKNKDDLASEPINSQINVSVGSDESYTNMKDILLKKHNLDLSPQFVYKKKSPVQMASEDKMVRSKFFGNNNLNIEHNDDPKKSEVVKEAEQKITIQEKGTDIQNKDSDRNNSHEMDIDEVIVTNGVHRLDAPITGFLFNHELHGIPESLDLSVSTTGYDDGDPDFPHCIDSSVLLSPKADLQLPMTVDNSKMSQEEPSFLSGLRKGGLSFFGHMSSADPKPNSSAPNQGNFNFTFGGEEKKGRSGFFSMFH